MCASCFPGFSIRKGECARCSNYATSLSSILAGAAFGFVASNLMVLAVVYDAGSTSTASSIKKIVLNHLQILSMLVGIDLNWPSGLKDFFALAGAASSIGEEVIQTGCVLNADVEGLGTRPFYFTQIIFVAITVSTMCVSALYWQVTLNGIEKCCNFRSADKGKKDEKGNPRRSFIHARPSCVGAESLVPPQGWR